MKTKRSYIKWIPTAERKPDGFGMYLVTVKKYAPGDPFKIKGWDGESVETGFDRFFPNTRTETNRGQWWAVRDSDVIAWAELPKPYEVKE